MQASEMVVFEDVLRTVAWYTFSQLPASTLGWGFGIPKFGNPGESRSSGIPNPENLNPEISGFPKSRKSQSRIFGIPEIAKTSGFPNFGIPKIFGISRKFPNLSLCAFQLLLLEATKSTIFWTFGLKIADWLCIYCYSTRETREKRENFSCLSCFSSLDIQQFSGFPNFGIGVIDLGIGMKTRHDGKT